MLDVDCLSVVFPYTYGLFSIYNLRAVNKTFKKTVYNFCSVTTANQDLIKIMKKVKLEIYQATSQQLLDKYCKNAVKLDMYFNINITDVSKLTNLTSLDLWGNAFVTDADLLKFTKLKTLSLKFNSFVRSVKKLVNLTSLNVSCNNTITDEDVRCLKNLTYLNLSNKDRKSVV